MKMDDKRFTHRKWLDDRQLFDGEEPFAIVDVYNQADKICDKFNELAEENKEIKIQYDNLKAQRDEFYRGARENANRVGQLEKENNELKELVSEVDNELEIRDIVCGAGKFRLEEWGKHRYHQFYKGDEELEDESVVIMLMEFEKENKELKQSIGVIYDLIDGYITIADKYRKPIKSLALGDDLGYWNGVYQYMKKLKERIGVL